MVHYVRHASCHNSNWIFPDFRDDFHVSSWILHISGDCRHSIWTQVVSTIPAGYSRLFLFLFIFEFSTRSPVWRACATYTCYCYALESSLCMNLIQEPYLGLWRQNKGHQNPENMVEPHDSCMCYHRFEHLEREERGGEAGRQTDRQTDRQRA